MTETYFCTFCGKSQSEVAKLIAGPGAAFICDECVHLCMKIVNDEPLDSPLVRPVPVAQPDTFTPSWFGHLSRIELAIHRLESRVHALEESALP